MQPSAEPTAYQLDYARGVAARQADERFNPRETAAWIIGYGDTILIEPIQGEEPE